jgi:hypothetical protein
VSGEKKFPAHENFLPFQAIIAAGNERTRREGIAAGSTAVNPLGLVGRFLPETPALRGSSGRRLRASSENGKSLTVSTTAGMGLDKIGK